MFEILHRNARVAVIIFLSIGFGLGCETNDDRTGSRLNDAGQTGDNDGKIGDDSDILEACEPACSECLTGRAAELFDWRSVPTFDIVLPERRWAYLQEHALDEEFEPACISFEGQSVGKVGVRFKGSYGTLIPCIDAQGKLICDKLSMKVKFNEVDAERRFYELKRLNFHSMINDFTKLHERLAYDLFRDMGIFSPRSAWAVLTVNGESYGLFSMVEQVDGRFIADRWPQEPDGDLYKEAWPGASSEISYYENKLATDAEDSSPEAFARFSSAIIDSEPQELGTELAKWTAPEYLARYLAVDDAIADVDGITAYYVSEDESWSGNHNFYFYKERKRDFFWMIPWDMDSTFNLWPDFSRIPHWSVVPEDCSQTYPVWDGANDLLAPGCDRFFQAISAGSQDYYEAIDSLLSGPFSEESMLAKIDKLASFIADAVAAEPPEKSKGVTTWKQEVAHLKRDIPRLRQRLEFLRDGKSVTPFGLDAFRVNGFEETDDLGFSMGSMLYSNADTTVSLSITRENALEGQRSARIDFEFRDSEDAWDQWLDLSMTFIQGTVDVRKMTGMRFWARSDRVRNLRFDLVSPANSAASLGVKKGWYCRVEPDASRIEVRFAQAEVADWVVSRGIDPNDPLEEVLRSVSGISVQPSCMGQINGFLGSDAVDKGFLEIDAVELFTE
ncbi:MAG: CotH kinase family protein [Deltaproteobacteria bacterium]|nr:CotH kinase family protein [Deltaproteobacteria bacterium]